MEQFYVGRSGWEVYDCRGTIMADNEGRLANLTLPASPIRFKKSNMPFMQMENISHFLRACESPPLNLPAHDRFLTVDLFEAKDPAQVVQCIHAFSRQANILFPNRFKTTIGPTKRVGAMSPATTGSNGGGGFGGFGRTRGSSNASSGLGHSASSALPSRTRALSPALTGGSNSSRATEGGARSPQGPTSSWSKKSDEGNTAPAWNIHQYGERHLVITEKYWLISYRLHGRRKSRQSRYIIRRTAANYECITNGAESG